MKGNLWRSYAGRIIKPTVNVVVSPCYKIEPFASMLLCVCVYVGPQQTGFDDTPFSSVFGQQQEIEPVYEQVTGEFGMDSQIQSQSAEFVNRYDVDTNPMGSSPFDAASARPIFEIGTQQTPIFEGGMPSQQEVAILQHLKLDMNSLFVHRTHFVLEYLKQIALLMWIPRILKYLQNKAICLLDHSPARLLSVLNKELQIQFLNSNSLVLDKWMSLQTMQQVLVKRVKLLSTLLLHLVGTEVSLELWFINVIFFRYTTRNTIWRKLVQTVSRSY